MEGTAEPKPGRGLSCQKEIHGGRLTQVGTKGAGQSRKGGGPSALRCHKTGRTPEHLGMNALTIPGEDPALASRLVSPETQTGKQRRPHQGECLARIHEALKTSGRTRVVMSCGTGKSLVQLWLAQESHARTILFLAPTLALLRQQHSTWIEEGWPEDWGGNVRSAFVCSDVTLKGAQIRAQARERVSTWHGHHTCTDPKAVAGFLDQRERETDVQLIFCTYASSGVIGEAVALSKGKRAIDLAIYDEAHNTAGSGNKRYASTLYDANLTVSKRVFFTATEKIVEASDDESIEVVASMSDERLYGRKCFHLGMRKAIEQGLTVPFRILIALIEEPSEPLQTDTSPEARRNFLLQRAVLHAMEAKSLRKAITFHNSIRASRGLELAVRTHGAGKVESFHIDSTQRPSERTRALERFRQSSRAVMSNAKCLVEGVDVPEVDLVCFGDPLASEGDLTQAVGRSTRLAPNKEAGYVLLPVIVPPEWAKDKDKALRRAGYKKLVEVLSCLMEEEEEDSYVSGMIGGAVEGWGASPKPPPGSLETRRLMLQEAIELLEIEGLDAQERRGGSGLKQLLVEEGMGTWWTRLMQYEEFKKSRKREPRRTGKTHLERLLYRWARSARERYSRDDVANERVSLLNKVGFDWVGGAGATDIDEWHLNLRTFIETHGRLPQGRGKEKGEDSLNGFLRRQREAYERDPVGRQKQVERLCSIPMVEGFIKQEGRDRWRRIFDEVAAFTKEHGRTPTCTVGRSKLEQSLGGWLSRQRQTGKGVLGTERASALETLQGFSWNRQDRERELHMARLRQLRKFVTETGTRPRRNTRNQEEKVLATWTLDQCRSEARENNPRLAAKIDWILGQVTTKQLTPRDQSVMETLSAIQQFVLNTGRRPSRRSTNRAEQRLGRILDEQRALARAGKQKAERMAMLKAIQEAEAQSNRKKSGRSKKRAASR